MILMLKAMLTWPFTKVLGLLLYIWSRSLGGPRARLDLALRPTVRADPARPGEVLRGVTLTVSNIGRRPTTIKSVSIRQYDGLAQQRLGRPARTFECPASSQYLSLPWVIEREALWVGFVSEDTDLGEMTLAELARTGRVTLCLNYSSQDRLIEMPLVLPPPEPILDAT